MKSEFYKAKNSNCGLEEGKIYFEDENREVTLGNGERVQASILRGNLKPIPVYEGELKEEWTPKKFSLLMVIHDFMMAEEMLVMLYEVHQKGKGLVCLAELPGEGELVQINVPHLWVP